MTSKGRPVAARRRPLADLIRQDHPHLEIEEVEEVIGAGRVRVDGAIITNSRSMVRQGSSIVVRPSRVLRGELKMQAALSSFGVEVGGRTALDIGASTGGFTSALLSWGAAKVYAVDTGHGQLLGSLRQNPLVVNLESTNLGDLGPDLVTDLIEVLCVDLSFLPLHHALPQFPTEILSPTADLVALVKPMYELHLGYAPTDRGQLAQALDVAVSAALASGWQVDGTMESPVTGARGAIEFLFCARRQGQRGAP